MTTHRFPRLAPVLVGVTVAGALLLTGCSSALRLLDTAAANAASAAPEIRDEDSGEIVEGGTTDVFTLRLGDCFNDDASDGEEDVYEVETVPCTSLHDYEVYHHAELPGGDFPVDMVAVADEICLAAFPEFVGVEHDASELYFNYYTPTLGSWIDGDRAIDCLVYGAEQTTGSLKGAAR